MFCYPLIFFATGVLQNGVTSGAWDEGGHRMSPTGPEHRAIVACVAGLVALATALWVIGRASERGAGRRAGDALADSASFLTCVGALLGIVAALAIARVGGPLDGAYRWFLAVDSVIVVTGAWLSWRSRSRFRGREFRGSALGPDQGTALHGVSEGPTAPP